MSVLDLKLVRDMGNWRGQVVAIVLIVACGIASYITMLSAYQSLKLSQATYYAQYGFGQVFSSLKSAPLPVANQIAHMHGVRSVEPRIVEDVILDVPGVAQPATGRLISIPEYRQPNLNRLYIAGGRYIEPGHGEVLVSGAFARANHLVPGDTVGAILNGKWERLRIVGIALSPEYVYEIKGTGDPFPDNKHFGVIWMGNDALATAFDMHGSFNDVVLSLNPGTNDEEVIDRLDNILQPYGGLGAFARRDQVSNHFLSEEIQQLRVTATLIPVIFLSVAAFLVHLLLSRLISLQRGQIAVLKAFGLTNTEIGVHYFKLVSVIVLGGTIVGTIAGLYLGKQLTAVYTDFYQFPILQYRASVRLIVSAVGISVLASFLGGFLALWRAVSLAPAEAMRPQPPAAFYKTVAEQLGLRRLFSTTGRIIVRNLERKPIQTFLSVLGIGAAISLLIVGRYMTDAISAIVDVQYRHVETQDLTVVFNKALPWQTLNNINQLPGVMESEPFRTMPVRVRYGHKHRTVSIIGLPYNGRLHRLLDKNLHEVALPPDGLILTSKLAQLLGTNSGKMVTVEVLEGARPVKTVPVNGVVDELVGVSGYMPLNALYKLTREQPTVSGAYLKVDSLMLPRLYAQLKKTPAVMGVSIRESAIDRFNETVAKTMGIFIAVLVAFAAIVAFGVVYNSARISLSERANELATLRIIGLTKAEVATILLGEQAVLTVLSLPFGALCGFGLTALLVHAHESELFRLPLLVTPASYSFAFLVVILVSLVTAFVINQQLSRLNVTAVLKAWE